MTAEKKPRADSKLDHLPAGRVAELRDGLLGGWRYDDARAWLRDACDLTVSMSALTAFYRRHCAPLVREARQLAALKAEAITTDAGLTDWDAASMERLRQMVFEFMADPRADLADTERMFRLLLRSRGQDLDRRKLAMLEERAAEAKAKLEAAASAAKAGGGISEETLRQIEEAAGLL